jgi:excisionase family DNA binding protein
MEERLPAKKEILRPTELQEMLPIGRTKLYALLADGSIPSYKVGNLRLIRRSDVDKWLERHKYTPGNSLRPQGSR